MQKSKTSYSEFRAAILSYASALPPEAPLSPEELADGILEYLVVTQRMDPTEFDGWPEDGLVTSLLSEQEAG